MKLFERLHCPLCQGRLASGSADSWDCTVCERVFPIADGVVDLGGDRDANRPRGHQFLGLPDAVGLLPRVQTAIDDRWPAFLGDTVVLGCGEGNMAEAIAASRTARTLLLLDTATEALRACRRRLAPGEAVAYAAVGDFDGALQDAVADTVICTGLLAGTQDARAFLATVHRVLKPGGRAAFVVPNRRYWQAMCMAMAETLVQLHAKERAWPDGQARVLEVLAHTRRLLVHRDDLSALAALDEKHLFDRETLEDWGHEIGFATAEAIPLDPDPLGVETARRICRDVGAPDSFTAPFGALAGTVGQTHFDLLGRQDASASMVLWLTKASGPRPRIFNARPASPSAGPVGPDAAVGGAEPRWSLEFLARDTPDGIVVAIGGWCLCNVPVRWVRLTLDGVARNAPVWRPRPDVHEVLNGRGLYHPMSAICSGLECELVFPDVHAADNVCSFRLEVILVSGVTVTGASPEVLVMNEQMVVAH